MQRYSPISDAEPNMCEDSERGMWHHKHDVEARMRDLNEDFADYEKRLAEKDRRIAELENALEDIEANCNGYGDIAGWACNRAAKALRPESSL